MAKLPKIEKCKYGHAAEVSREIGQRICVAYERKTGHPMAMRADRGSLISWPLPNVQLGVSVEDQATADERIPILLQTPAAVRFVSLEPLLAPVDFTRWMPHNDGEGACSRCGCDFDQDEPHECPPGFGPRLDGVIAGGESGPKADQVAAIGNSVPPEVAESIVRANFPEGLE